MFFPWINFALVFRSDVCTCKASLPVERLVFPMTLKLIAMLGCSVGLACASTYITSTTCESMTIVTDPTSCSVNDAWSGQYASVIVNPLAAPGEDFLYSEVSGGAIVSCYTACHAEADFSGPVPTTTTLTIGEGALAGDHHVDLSIGGYRIQHHRQ